LQTPSGANFPKVGGRGRKDGPLLAAGRTLLQPTVTQNRRCKGGLQKLKRKSKVEALGWEKKKKQKITIRQKNTNTEKKRATGQHLGVWRTASALLWGLV